MSEWVAGFSLQLLRWQNCKIIDFFKKWKITLNDNSFYFIKKRRIFDKYFCLICIVNNIFSILFEKKKAFKWMEVEIIRMA